MSEEYVKVNKGQANTLDNDKAQAPEQAEEELEANAPEIEEGMLVTLLQRERERTDELTDQLQRAQAELVNYRRRMEQEQVKTRTRAVENTLRKLLPMADDFHRALKSLPADVEDNSWVQGFRLIETNLWKALESEGVTIMVSVGKPFEPARHEAVVFDENTSGDHMVVEEFQRGYLIQNRVLRPAMVKVGSLDNDSADEDQLIDIDGNR